MSLSTQHFAVYGTPVDVRENRVDKNEERLEP